MKNKIEKMSWEQIDILVDKIYNQIVESGVKYENIYGIPRGGLILSVLLSHKLDIPIISNQYSSGYNTLFVDDILDTGNTVGDFMIDIDGIGKPSPDIAVLVWNEKSKIKPSYFGFKNQQNVWIKFPWEMEIKDGVSKVNCDL